ncbi:MAG: hypothetical protein A2X84_08670 [Desulfuromonadaceae bacterium GWC2_58_13]|nr:MAG: hypothetical protein A2X84_08670 [Desulfuromonadaceae bacterium GWC2_58_13]HAD04173.1 hypothetical protein [Desulfuromonas sp.]
MKRNIDNMVHVMVRPGVDLSKLCSSDSPMCGSIGRLIAKAVLDGNGQALVRLKDIRMAIDTTDGVNALLDNFDLTDPLTQSPLLFALLKDL